MLALPSACFNPVGNPEEPADGSIPVRDAGRTPFDAASPGLDASLPAAPDAAPPMPDATSPAPDAAAPGRDSGVIVVADDAGLIPALPPLSESLCRTPPMPSPTCPVDGGCFMLVSQDGLAEVLVSLAELEAAQAWVVHATEQRVLFQVRRGSAAGPERLVSVDVATRARIELDSQPPSQNVTYQTAATEPTYGTWLVRGTGAGSRKYDLLLAVGDGAATGAMPGIPMPTTRGVAVGTDYFVGHAGVLASYYPAGGGTLQKLASGEELVDLAAVDGSAVYYLVAQKASVTTELRRYDRKAFTSEVLAQASERLVSLALVGQTVYALGGQGLWEIAPGSSPRWRYRGLFPQHAGTLDPKSLVAKDGKLYLAQICHFDADAPEYGTVEIDPVLGTARWLEEDPDFPFVGAPAARQSWDTPPILVAGRLLVFAP
ncbi:MAG: hypothetical protein QM765_11135 [Myxococcales bacterium]